MNRMEEGGEVLVRLKNEGGPTKTVDKKEKKMVVGTFKGSRQRGLRKSTRKKMRTGGERSS